MQRIYIDGVFDLFHIGHVKSLECAQNCLENSNNVILVVGIISDKDCESYKRLPIINENNRVEIIKSLKVVDEVIFPGPLVLTLDFIEKNNIDLVVHGFSNDDDRKKQQPFFQNLIDIGKFKEIPYYSKISTTDIIKKIKNC